MSVVTIIGAGWLGQPLAHHLKKLSYSVYASRTTAAGVSQLIQHGLNSFCFDFDQPATLAEQLAVQQTDIVIGCFPPGFRKHKTDDYIQYWSTLVRECKQAGVKKVIMISSTGVYPDRPEPMTEEKASLEIAHQDPDFSESSRILLAAEQQVIDSGLPFVILRCSGLFGPQRHPSRFVSRLKQVSSQAPANMLHLKDALGTITFAITHLSNEICNATTPNTVNKAEFYQAALNAIHADEPLPPIVDKPDKQVLSHKICALGYTFHYQNTLDALSPDE